MARVVGGPILDHQVVSFNLFDVITVFIVIFTTIIIIIANVVSTSHR